MKKTIQRKDVSLIGVFQDDGWGFIDKTGKIIVSPQFDYVHSFSVGVREGVHKT